MENLSAEDLQIFREKSRTVCGAFRIPLEKLEYEELLSNPRQRDGKNVNEVAGRVLRGRSYLVRRSVAASASRYIPPTAELTLPGGLELLLMPLRFLTKICRNLLAICIGSERSELTSLNINRTTNCNLTRIQLQSCKADVSFVPQKIASSFECE